jgi:phage terminase small subunit
MAKLTPKQEAFAQLVAGGKSYADAYREAYNATGKDSTAHSEGSRLAKHPQISARLDAITQQKTAAIARRAVDDRSLVTNKLRAWVEDGIDPKTGDEPTQAQLQAAQLLGRTVAMFSDKQVVETNDRSPDEVAAEIERRLAEANSDRQTEGKPLH